MNDGLIQTYTGNGKGKTTAAVGQAVRAAGAGMKVIFFQFLKHGAFASSEEKMLKKYGIKVVRFKEKSPLFDVKLDINELRVQVANDWAVVNAAVNSGKYDMVVLDEVTHLINLKLISESVLFSTVNPPTLKLRRAGCKLKTVNFVLTGRGASKGLIKAADLVTNMKEIKHPYRKGVKARRGIDF